MKEKSTKGIWKVISASSMGTMIEWYDFYIFGSLAPIISTQFFPKEIYFGLILTRYDQGVARAKSKIMSFSAAH